MMTSTIAYFGIGVFLLMSVGIVLTILEFTRLSDEITQKRSMQDEKDAAEGSRRADMRVVHSNNDAAARTR